MKSLLLTIMGLLCSLYATQAQNSIDPKVDNSIRIMSYNVRNCRGMDEKIDYQRVADVINKVNPDLLAIQELDSASTRSNGVFALKELADLTRLFYTYSPSIDFQGGKYGIGILSKQKPIRYWTFSLPGREEKRSFLVCEFEEYIMCCSHFSLTHEDQVLSVPIIFEKLKDIHKPLFFAGDMNSIPESLTQKALQDKFTPLNNVKEFTSSSDKPFQCIDYIYGYKNGNSYTVLNRQVLSDESIASDHFPLFVDVRLKKNVNDIFRTKPFLQNPINNGMTISWFTNVPVHSWIEYGTDRNLGQRKELIVDGQIICNNTLHKIRLTDLKPGTTYYYRVCSQEILLYEAYKKEFGNTAYSEIYSFTVPSADKTDFTAVIFNDLHKQKAVYDKLTEQIKNVPFDFVIFNGDCIDDPKNESQVVDILAYLNDGIHAQDVPAFYLRGNHEIRNAYSIQLKSIFDYVGGKTYGAFTWGNSRFVFLDCGEDKPDTTWVYYGLNDFNELRQEQVHFLKQELSSRDYAKADKRILIHHIPLYGMPDSSYLPCFHLWSGLLSKAPFNISINAHTHRFAYWEKGSKGNNYPVIIGGGNKLESATVMILNKIGKKMTLKIMDTKGNLLKELDL